MPTLPIQMRKRRHEEIKQLPEVSSQAGGTAKFQMEPLGSRTHH